jgi:hypothetical protein
MKVAFQAELCREKNQSGETFRTLGNTPLLATPSSWAKQLFALHSHTLERGRARERERDPRGTLSEAEAAISCLIRDKGTAVSRKLHWLSRLLLLKHDVKRDVGTTYFMCGKKDSSHRHEKLSRFIVCDLGGFDFSCDSMSDFVTDYRFSPDSTKRTPNRTSNLQVCKRITNSQWAFFIPAIDVVAKPALNNSRRSCTI